MNTTFLTAGTTTPPPGRFSRGACREGRYGNVHGGCAGKLEKNRACGKGLVFRYLRFGGGACTGGVR